MKRESLPSVKSVYQALEEAALDCYGFAVVCHGGVSWMAEPNLLDALLLGLENFWFNDDAAGRLSHHEFREELFKAVWERCRDRAQPAKIGTDVPLGHDEMPFFKLPQLARAALFLRTKKRMSYASISLILGVPEGLARSEVERSREFLLGRRVKDVEWSEETF
jgi:hypothetical protein